MAILREGDTIPSDATNGLVIHGGKGRIQLRGIFINVSDLPIPAGGLHLPNGAAETIQILGSSVLSASAGTSPSDTFVHITADAPVTGTDANDLLTVLGGKGTVVVTEDDEEDIILNLGTLNGSFVLVGNTQMLDTAGSSIAFLTRTVVT